LSRAAAPNGGEDQEDSDVAIDELETMSTSRHVSGERVRRRGLLAGLAALGAAAAVKLSGAGKAEAVDNSALIIGNDSQTAESETRLVATIAAGPGLQVVMNGAAASTVSDAAIRGANAGPAGSAGVIGNGGADGTGVAGAGRRGVTGLGTSDSGVLGQASTGRGVIGISTTNNVGVKGVSNTGGLSDETGNGSGDGVEGRSGGGNGVHGVSTSGAGMRGNSVNFVGAVGLSDFSHGLYGFTSHAGFAGLVGDNGAGGMAGYFAGSVQITGNLQVGGAKNAVIKMPDGTNAVVYCQEAPEPYFEDFGRAQLIGGIANVPIEREFAALVAGGNYHVFTEPEGETRGLFVARRTATSFEVREIGGGIGNVPFSYRLVTRRKDIEGRRFARVVDQVGPQLAATRAALGVSDRSPRPPFAPNVPSPVGPQTPNPAGPPPVNPISPNPTPPGPRSDGSPR
jgi:hypothetical protein